MEIEKGNYYTPDLVTEGVSPYDASYPVSLLANGIQRELNTAQDVAKNIYRAVVNELPVLTEMKKVIETGCRYVVDVSDNTLKAIESGALKLTQENGKTFAQLKIDGKYGEKLPIKKEVFHQKLDTAQISNALQMQALQQQIQDVADQLILIDSSVREVLQGQQNDRISLYYSGLALFLESKNATDEGLKNALQAQALHSLSDATFQLKLTMQSDIKYLENKEYNNVKGKRRELISEHMSNINRSFAFIHQATMLRAGIYCYVKELASMVQVLEEYSYFIDTVVSRSSVLLSQYDAHDDGTKKGLWAARSQLKLDTAGLVQTINNPNKTLYLNIAQEVKM